MVLVPRPWLCARGLAALMRARTRPSSCERCGGPVRRKGASWWCWACDEACQPVPLERRTRRRLEKYGSEAQIEWLHNLPCVAYMAPGHQCGPWDMDLGRAHIQAVHVRARAAGGTADDQVPGCWVMHEEAGEMGTSRRAAFEAVTGLDLVERAAEIAADWAAVSC